MDLEIQAGIFKYELNGIEILARCTHDSAVRVFDTDNESYCQDCIYIYSHMQAQMCTRMCACVHADTHTLIGPNDLVDMHMQACGFQHEMNGIEI